MEIPVWSSRRSFLSFWMLLLSGCSAPKRVFEDERADCSTRQPIWEAEEWRLPNYDAQNTNRTVINVSVAQSVSERWSRKLFEQDQLSTQDLDFQSVSNLIVADGQVYTSFVHPELGTIEVHAFDADSGREVWNQRLGKSGEGIPIRTMVVGETVLVNVFTTDGWRLSAFNASNGTRLWEATSGPSASLIGATVYTHRGSGSNTEQELVRISSQSGDVCSATDAVDGLYGTPTFSGDRLGYARAVRKRDERVTKSSIVAVSAEREAKLWESRPLNGTVTTPLIHSERESAFITVTGENDIARVSTETGDVRIIKSISDVFDAETVHQARPCTLTSDNCLIIHLTYTGVYGDGILKIDLESREASMLDDGRENQTRYSTPIAAKNTILYTSYDQRANTSSLNVTNATTGATRRTTVAGITTLQPIIGRTGAIVFSTHGLSTYTFG